MKNITIVVVLSILVCLLLIITNWSWRWILFNGWEASEYAEQLLLGHSPNNQFVDYVVYTTTSGCVIFGRHEEERGAMAYCPNGIPVNVNKSELGNLTHLIGAWYKMT